MVISLKAKRGGDRSESNLEGNKLEGEISFCSWTIKMKDVRGEDRQTGIERMV